MALKTPRTVLRDYMETVSTDRGSKTQRRRSGEQTAKDPLQDASIRSTTGRSGRSPHVPRGAARNLHAAEQDVTPRHLIQSMLTVQGTAQPVTRRQKRVSDAAMPPPSSSSTRRRGRRRSLVSTPDMEDVTHRFTPRTNIAGFLEQAPEETPALQPAPVASDSHTASNVSSFTLNDVEVSMLERSSGGAVVGSLSTREVRVRSKKRNLNIPLPQATPSSRRGKSMTPSEGLQYTQTPEGVRDAVGMDGGETLHSVSITGRGDTLSLKTPTVQLEGDRAEQNQGITPAADFTPGHADHSVGNTSKSVDRNVFSDVFGGMEHTEHTLPAREAGDEVSPGERVGQDDQGMDDNFSDQADQAGVRTPQRQGQASSQSTTLTPGSARSSGRKRNRAQTPEAIDREEAEKETDEQEVNVSLVAQGGKSTPRHRSLASLQGGDRTPTPHAGSRKGRDSSVSTPSNRSQSGAQGKEADVSRTPTALNMSHSERVSRRGAKRSLEDIADAPRNTPTPSKRTRSAGSPRTQDTAASLRRSLRNTQTPTRLASTPQRMPLSRHSSSAAGTPHVPGSSSPTSSAQKNIKNQKKRASHMGTSQLDVTDNAQPGTPIQSLSRAGTSTLSQHLTPPLHSVVESTPTRRGSSIRGPRTSTPRPRQTAEGTLQAAITPGVAGDSLSQSHHAAHGTSLADEEDLESEEEGKGYSPLKTPRLPQKQRTPATNTQPRKSGAAFAKLSEQHGRQRKTAGCGASQAARKAHSGLPTSVVKATFTHFCKLRVSRDAIEEVEKISEQYWKNMAEDLEAYATHAHRKTIDESDVNLLMRRQGFITDKCSLNTLIATYLPLEQRQELIPIARSGNKLEPSR